MSGGVVIVDDRAGGGGAGGAERGVRRAAEGDDECLVGLVLVVGAEGHGDRLGRVAGREGERAGLGAVVLGGAAGITAAQ